MYVSISHFKLSFMKVTAAYQPEERPLKIDFESYTDNDPAFKNELTQLLIGNIHELLESLHLSVQLSDKSIFSKTLHKVAVCIDMLSEPEVVELISQVKDAFDLQEPPLLARSAYRLSRLLRELVGSLEAALNE
jgi:hypothetical protein